MSNKIKATDWLKKSKDAIRNEYVSTEISVKELYEKYKDECKNLKPYHIRKTVEGLSKKTPRALSIEEAYEESISPLGITSSKLRSIMSKHYGTRQENYYGISVPKPNFTREDYIKVTSALYVKAKREGKVCTIVPLYAQKLTNEELNNFVLNTIPKGKQITEAYLKSLLSLLKEEGIIYETKAEQFSAIMAMVKSHIEGSSDVPKDVFYLAQKQKTKKLIEQRLIKEITNS